MTLPNFLKESGSSYLYNGEGQFVYYIPENYFSDTKSPIAQVVGQYVETLGIMDWGIIDNKGKSTGIHPFKLPTIFSCKPTDIEKVKDFKINSTAKGKDYRILHFNPGDEVISDIHLPQLLDNVEIMFQSMIVNGDKIPHSVPYDKLHEYFEQSMRINGNSFNVNMQLFGCMVSEMCRDKNDLSKPFRYTSMQNMTSYQQISVKLVPKFISPYIALTSENFDESVMASVLLSANNASDVKETPLEKVMTN